MTESTNGMTAEERELRARAARLARPPRADRPTGQIEVLISRVGEERYALDLRRLTSARPVRDLTPVPCTPPVIAGVMNVRGQVYTVLDLALALRLPGPSSIGEASRVLFVDAPTGLVGLLVDEVEGVERLTLGDLERSLSDNELARGVAGEGTVLLDLDRLLAPGSFDVHEELS
jgi:purine-binding chemotaxis protein CheW